MQRRDGTGAGAARTLMVAALMAAPMGALALAPALPEPLVPPEAAALAEAALAPLGCLKTGTYRAIWEVQGDGPRSPYEGEVLDDVRGIVTLNDQRGTGGPYEPWGLWLQAHQPDCDEATSDGVFVYTGPNARAIRAGDLLELDGAAVQEYSGPETFLWEQPLTELVCRTGCTMNLLRRDLKLPAALEYQPPVDEAEAAGYNEAREGMLVQVTEAATAVAAVNPYDEFVVLRGAQQDRLHAEGGPAGHRIIVEGEGVAAAKCGAPGFGDLRTFDAIPYAPEGPGTKRSGILGPLTYGFNAYKVHQDDDRACVHQEPGDRSSWDPHANPPPVPDADTLTVASMNALSFFDTVDDPDKADDLNQTPAEYARKSRKLAAAICDDHGLARPDIVALQEVEGLPVLQRLVGDIAARCGITYAPHTAGAPDDRSIENSFLVRADRVSVLAVSPRQGCSAKDWAVVYEPLDTPSDVVCNSPTPFYLHKRPPLELVAKVNLAGQDRIIDVLNNHLKSKLTSSLCVDTDCTDWRLEQAEHLAGVVRARLAAEAGANVVVVGDLNDHYGSAPLAALTAPEGPLANLWAEFQGPPGTGQGTITRYSYNYQGKFQTLDHALVAGGLATVPHVASPRHINTDWPGFHELDDTMLRVSDHDPFLVGFHFG